MKSVNFALFSGFLIIMIATIFVEESSLKFQLIRCKGKIDAINGVQMMKIAVRTCTNDVQTFRMNFNPGRKGDRAGDMETARDSRHTLFQTVIEHENETVSENYDLHLVNRIPKYFSID